MDDKKYEIDLNKMVVEVYTKIAVWHNDDYNSSRNKGDALKVVSHDIVQTILEDIFSQINVKTNVEVKRGDVVVGGENSKDIESFSENKPKSVFDKIFDKKTE